MALYNYEVALNEATPFKLMYNSFVRDTWIMSRTPDRYRDWRGGRLIFPFEGNESDNYQSGGGLVPANEINIARYIRGEITDFKECRSALKLYAEDLHRHGAAARVPMDTFLKVKVMKLVKKATSRWLYLINHNLLQGGHFVEAIDDGDVGGVGGIKIDRPDKLTHNEKLIVRRLASDGTQVGTDATVWTDKINMNTGHTSLVTTIGGSTAVSGTATWTQVGAGGKILFYLPGDQNGGGFTSLRSQILPASAGGSDKLFGQTKTDWQFLQSIVRDASTGGTITTASQFVESLYDLITDLVMKGQPNALGETGERLMERGNESIRGRGFNRRVEIAVSIPWFAIAQKYFQTIRGDQFIRGVKEKIRFYDVSTIEFEGPTGEVINLRGVKALRDDVAYILGTDCLRFATMNYIWTYKTPEPDGNKWHSIRDDNTGYSYICDWGMYGDLILKRPQGAGALYNLPAPSGVTIA